MSTYKEKCPICGGTIEVQQGKTFGVCDSCGNTISLSELSRIKSQKERSQIASLVEEKSENEEYSYAFDLNESSELSNKALYEKIELALEAEKWNIANEYCDEILKRNPKDAYAYLYKLLAELRLYKKEDLFSCGKDFTEYENYRLFSRFADEYSLIEIKNYLERSKQKIQEEKLQFIYQTACYTLQRATDEQDYRNVIYYLSQLSGYKDSYVLLKRCSRSIRNIQFKDKLKKVIKTIIIFSIISAIIGAIPLTIIISITSKKNKYDIDKYDIDKIEVSIVSVEKKYNPNESPYTNGCYYIYFDYQIKNETGADIDYIQIIVYYTDNSGKSIGTVTTRFGGSGSYSMNLKSGEKQIHETYMSEHQPEKNQFFTTLYNNDFSKFTVQFKITSVTFSNGEYYYGD